MPASKSKAKPTAVTTRSTVTRSHVKVTSRSKSTLPETKTINSKPTAKTASKQSSKKQPAKELKTAPQNSRTTKDRNELVNKK